MSLPRKIVFFKNPTPDQDRDSYAKAARAHGLEYEFVPVLTHNFVDQDGLKDYLVQIAKEKDGTVIDSLIITSQRAVEALAMALRDISKSKNSSVDASNIVSRVREFRVYTVGPATADLIKSYGFNNICGGADAGNGTILAQQIVADAPKKCIFFTGETRRDIIPVTLRKYGIDCVEYVVYQTMKSPLAEDDWKICLSSFSKTHTIWAVFFSPSGADGLTQYLGHAKTAAIGPTTESFLVENGRKPDAVATRPDPTSLLKAIIETDTQ
ncbi:tetrapyrrole biosynthesis, uroporphyrinogen III synthase [Dipodascopsis uninucleata]